MENIINIFTSSLVRSIYESIVFLWNILKGCPWFWIILLISLFPNIKKTPYVLNKSVFLSFLKKWKREKNIDTALLTIQSLLNGFIIGANKRYHR